jgi:ActR/RegA family two-component response regulator
MENARVLILDDDEQWLRTLASVLEGKVASVTCVQSLEAAVDCVERCYYNVAIVDLRLHDHDPFDTSGMQFLAAIQEHGLGDVLAPIMCTAYGSLKSAVAALRDYHVVDFIDKSDFSADALIASVNKALEQRHCARRIQVEFGKGYSIADLWTRKDWAAREDEHELAKELHDLFCRLFPKANQLWVQPVLTGQSGAGVVEVAPSYGDSAGEICIVKFGKRDTIRREIENYTEYVDPFVSNQSTTKLDGVIGRKMGAIRYRLIGAGDAKATSLADYFLKGGHSVGQVCEVLDHLFDVSCRRWYDNRQRPAQRSDLVDLYTRSQHIQWEEVWEAAANCGIDITRSRLEFPGVAELFLNPRRWLEARENIYECRAWQAVTHGDLNEHNVMVTPEGHCWLIDFYRTGMGHILRDFVELETAFKFNLTPPLSFAERKQFETILLSQRGLKARIKVDSGKPYARSAAIIGHLRTLASEALGPERDMDEYQVALLLHTLKLLSAKFLGRDTRAHVLLSAAILADKLALS